MVSTPELAKLRPWRAKVLCVNSAGRAVLGMYLQGAWRRVSGQCRIRLKEGEWIEVVLEEQGDCLVFRVVSRA
jgi:hypothetical protein